MALQIRVEPAFSEGISVFPSLLTGAAWRRIGILNENAGGRRVWREMIAMAALLCGFLLLGAVFFSRGGPPMGRGMPPQMGRGMPTGSGMPMGRGMPQNQRGMPGRMQLGPGMPQNSNPAMPGRGKPISCNKILKNCSFLIFKPKVGGP